MVADALWQSGGKARPVALAGTSYGCTVAFKPVNLWSTAFKAFRRYRKATVVHYIGIGQKLKSIWCTMSYDCYCDYDSPTFYYVEIRTARKEHKCYECSGKISKGERYEHTRGKWDGYFSNFNVCCRCHDIRIWTKNNVPCLCWGYGNLIDDCKEAIEEATRRAPDETKGLYFAFLRRLVKINIHNHRLP